MKKKITNYKRITVHGHPRACKQGLVVEHLVMAEEALGRYIPKEHPVHHADGTRTNINCNLVVCENNAYHRLLHVRLEAYKKTGNPNMRKCQFCKKYDRDVVTYFNPSMHSKHKKCYAAYRRGKYKEEQGGRKIGTYRRKK